MTNVEVADKLEKLARRLREAEEIEMPTWYKFCTSKEEVVKAIKAIGGKWLKRESSYANSEYATIDLDSQEFPITVSIHRDKVCRRTITWDCEPLLAPEDEAEVQEAMAGK